MKRFFVVLLAVLTVVSILSSCSGEVGPGSGSSATPTIEEEMKSESKNAMPLFGTVNSIDEVEFVTGKGLSESEDREITADENGIKSTYHIVYYDSISEELAAHLNTIPKEQFKIPSIKNKIDTTKNYVVLFRSCYFKGKDKATPAFRKVYILDKSSLNKNTVLLQEVTFSPDFKYDIDNQIEVSSGMPVRYNWANGETEVADSFIEDTTTDLSALIGGISGKWLLVDPNNNPVRSEHVDATYVLKVAKTNAVCFHEFEIGSFTAEHLRVSNYVYNGTDEHDYAFFIVQKYPEGYRHDWAVECYWYDSGKWHYTRQIQTDGDLIPIWYKDVTDTKLSGFFDEFKAIGNITRIYQAYKGLDEYLEDNLYGSYVVEYNTAHANLRTAIENPRGKQNSSHSSWAGLLKDDTVAYAHVQYNTNTTSHTACIITRQDYTSYIYLPIELVDNRLVINGKYLDTLQSFYYEEST